MLTPTSASVSTSVSAVALLLIVWPSDDVTVSSAWLVRSAPSGVSASTVPVRLMLAVTLLAMFPRLQTTMSPDASSVMEQTPLPPEGTLYVAVMFSTWKGMVSVTTAPVAVPGPRFCTLTR